MGCLDRWVVGEVVESRGNVADMVYSFSFGRSTRVQSVQSVDFALLERNFNKESLVLGYPCFWASNCCQVDVVSTYAIVWTVWCR